MNICFRSPHKPPNVENGTLFARIITLVTSVKRVKVFPFLLDINAHLDNVFLTGVDDNSSLLNHDDGSSGGGKEQLSLNKKSIIFLIYLRRSMFWALVRSMEDPSGL